MEMIPAKDSGNNANNDQNNNNEQEQEEFTGSSLYVNGKYCKNAHIALVKEKVEKDMQIPSIIENLGKELCNFIEVSHAMGKSQLKLSYHPNPDADIGESLKWVDVEATCGKYGDELYKQVSKKKVTWYMKTLDGNMDEYFGAAFLKDFIDSVYDTKMDEFVKKASKFILYNPHKQITTYGVYLLKFKNYIKATEPDYPASKILNLLHNIANGLKSVVKYEERTKSPAELYKIICSRSTRMSISSCQYYVYNKLSKIDLVAQQAENEMQELEQEAEREKELEQAKRMERLQNLKIAHSLKSIEGVKKNSKELDEALDKKRKREQEEFDKDAKLIKDGDLSDEPPLKKFKRDNDEKKDS
jgi:hypothetical protein